MTNNDISLEVVIKYLKAAGYSEAEIKNLTSETLYKYTKEMIKGFISFHQETLVPAINNIPSTERTQEMFDLVDPLNVWKSKMFDLEDPLNIGKSR